MSQRTIDINLPVLFQKGAGFFLAAPITQFQNNFGEIFSATRNTCQTNSILRGGGVENFTNPRSNLQNALDQLEQRLTALATTSKDKSDISENICKLRSLVTKLYDIFPNVMSIVNVASPGKNKILTMNFAGYEDWDHCSVNKNEHQQLISQFLTGTGKNPQYFSKDLMVLINNDGYPSSGRSLTAQENEITQGLLKFFNENNYPHSFFEGTETREFIFDSNYSSGGSRNKFRLTHYIQSLFTAIMLMYIDESAQNRRTIFDNFQHLLTDLQHKRKAKAPAQQEAIDFLIQEITKKTELSHRAEDKAIKCLAYTIFMQLEMCEHVTQIEFVKFSSQHRRLADGFFQGENYFFVPISSLLMTYRSSLKLAENDSIFEFLDRIEKFSPQFETNELMIDEFKVGMQNLTQIDLRNAFIKIKSLFAENSEIFNSFDKETQDLIRANRFKTVSDIQKATDEEFKLIPIEKLSSFNHPEEQYKIFFAPSSGNGRHGRYKVITKFQLEIIHPDAISRIFWNHEAVDESGLNYFVSQNILYFKPEQLHEIGFRCLNPQNIQALLFNRLTDILPTQLLAVDLKTLPEKILHKVLSERFGDFKSDKFIGLDFKLLNEPERILILENHMDVVSAEQIQTLNLKMLNESKPELLSRLLDCKRNCFSPDQLRYLILIDITYLTMISGLSEESNRGFIKYFATPELFPLTKSILDDMPKELRLIYFICYQNFIPEDLTSEFAFVISAVFQKPNEYSPDLLLDLITKCPQDLIASLIKDIDINEFPKVHLPVLFNRYLPVLATCKKLDEFSINSFGAITNSDDRLYILDVLLDHYIRFKQTEKIQLIPFDVLNNQEIELIINRACNKLISEQVKKIRLSRLNRKVFMVLLDNDKHGNCIVLDQIQDLDFSDSMIASYIIEKTKLVPNLTIKQIQAINLSEIGEGAVKKLINAKQVIPNAESIEIYKNLTDDQVTQIDLKLVSSENRTGFMEKHARLFTTHQIQTLNFNQDHSFKMPPVRIKILKNLRDAGKLIFLNEDQITQLDIFNPKYKNVKEMFWNDFLQVPSFVKICTHGQCEIINDDTILSLNLDSVVPEFGACVYEKSFDRFSTVKQVAIIKKLAGENEDYSKIDRIKEKISSMNLAQVEKIDEKVFAILITEYIGNLSLIQLSSIDWHSSSKGKMWAQKRFCELLNLDFFDQKPYLLGKQQPTQEKLRSWPNEFKVAILNTNFLHGNFEFVEPGMRQYFLESIRFMFAHVQNYLEAVDHILLTIDDWTNQTQEKNDLIRSLSPEYFSIAAHNQKERSKFLGIIKKYGPVFSNEQFSAIQFFTDKDLINLFASDERIFFNLPNKIFFKVFIERMSSVKPESIRKIDVKGSAESPLIFEIKIDETHSITKEITDEQLKSIPPAIMKTFEPALLTKILDIKPKIFTPDQIQAIEIKSKLNSNGTPITDDKYAPISAILLLNRAEDMTPNQIQSIDLVENNDNAMNIYNEIVKRNKNKTPISLLRESHRFGDLTNNQLNHIPFSSDNVQEILNYDLEDRINISLCEMNLRRNLNLPQLKNYLQTNRNKYLYVIEKWTPMFSNEQINSIELDESDLNNKTLIDLFASEERILFNLPSKIFFRVFIERMANLNLDWLKKIEIAGSTESPLIFEIKIDETHSITKEITDEQLKSIPPEIMKTFEPGLITKILDIKSKVFTPAQIQAIEIKSEMDQNNLPITDNEYSQIAAILLLNRANDITPNQIKNMDLLTKRKGIDPNVNKEIIARNENENAISLLRKAHRFCDLSVEQLNQCIDFGNQDDIKELIACDLLGRITLQLQEPTKIFAETKIERQLNLPLLKGNLESQQYLLMIKEWSGMFKFEQLMSCIMELDIKDINGLLNLRHNNLLEREIITGILLYKYCCQPQITCNEIKKSVEAYVDFDIRYGLYFFNCIMLATEHVNSHSMEGKILFHEIAKKFFEAFDFWELLNSQNKFSEEFFTFANHTLTPDEFGFFIWEMGVNCPDDRKNEFLNRLKLVAEYHFFGGTYPSDYRNVLQRIKFKDVQLNNGSITKELVFAK